MRKVCFAALLACAGVVFFRPLYRVISGSIRVDQYSPLLLAIPVSLALIHLDRHRIFRVTSYCAPAAAAFLLGLAAFFYLAGGASGLEPSQTLSLSIFLFVLSVLAAFLWSFGPTAFRAALFPLLFLVFMAPLPDRALEATIAFLQNGSVEATCLLLRLFHVPFLRDGVFLTLPRVTIEVAKECSGIRSSLVLVMADLVLAFLYLRGQIARAVLAILVVPITIAKNGLRIFTLSMLGMYVDPSFLHGNLHRYGGILFFAVGFAALFVAIWALELLERFWAGDNRKGLAVAMQKDASSAVSARNAP